MNKVTVEPKRLVELFRRALMNATIDGALIRFTPSGVIATVTKGTYGAFGTYRPTYFKTYEIAEDVDIKVTPIFLKNLESLKMNNVETCSVGFDLPNNRLLFEVGGDKWSAILPNPDIKTLGIDERKNIKDVPGVGLLATSVADNPQFQAILSVDKMGTPKAERVTLSLNDKTMLLKWDMDGDATRDMQLETSKVRVPRKIITPEDKQNYTFHMQYVIDILANFVGEIVITVAETAMFVTQVSTDMSLMYFVATT